MSIKSLGYVIPQFPSSTKLTSFLFPLQLFLHCSISQSRVPYQLEIQSLLFLKKKRTLQCFLEMLECGRFFTKQIGKLTRRNSKQLPSKSKSKAIPLQYFSTFSKRNRSQRICLRISLLLFFFFLIKLKSAKRGFGKEERPP